MMESSSKCCFPCCTARLLVLTLLLSWRVQALVPCNTTKQCQGLLVNYDTKCIFLGNSGGNNNTGVCSNPFSMGGCLAQHLKDDWNNKNVRVCSSEDSREASQQGHCRPSPMDYHEVRFLSQNWESAYFEGWIQQILLSELLEVPTSMETGIPGRNIDFYNYNLNMDDGTANDWQALNTALDYHGDCELATLHGKSCAHVMPEIWDGHDESIRELLYHEKIEPPVSMGAVGKSSWFIPGFTAMQDPSLLSYFGLRGEENRHKLASLLLWPTTWKDYCEHVSHDNCTSSDITATRAPNDEDEAAMYHQQSNYQGYFRFTNVNNCTLNPTTCRGHMADYPCDWASFANQQAYHNDISVEVVSYTHHEQSQILAAAIATKSNLLLQWWTPDVQFQSLVATDFELFPISLPMPNQDCMEHRINVGDQCSGSEKEQVGDPLGACEEREVPLKKVISKSLHHISKGNHIPEAAQSPAYDAITAFTISNFQLGKIFDYWQEAKEEGYPSAYGARAATCRWVVENMEHLEAFIPRNYPRVVHEAENASVWHDPLNIIALVFAIIAALFVLFVCGGVYKQRNRQVMKYAQLEFMCLLLIGLIMVSLAAILMAVPPTNASCVARDWLFNIGYTLELIPLIVKVAAIGRMLYAARKCQRVVLERTKLLKGVALICLVVVLYLVVWTVVDPSQKQSDLKLTSQTTEEGQTVVSSTSFCQSAHSNVWRFISVTWHVLMLILATAMAFHTRKLQHDINETQVLAVLIYSHCLFVMLRVVSLFLEESIGSFRAALSRSILLSTDSVATCCIYFLPKLLSSDVPRRPRLHMGFAGDIVARAGNVYGNVKKRVSQSRQLEAMKVGVNKLSQHLPNVTLMVVPEENEAEMSLPLPGKVVDPELVGNVRWSGADCEPTIDRVDEQEEEAGDDECFLDETVPNPLSKRSVHDAVALSTATCQPTAEQALSMTLRCRHCGVVN